MDANVSEGDGVMHIDLAVKLRLRVAEQQASEVETVSVGGTYLARRQAEQQYKKVVPLP